MVLDANDEGWFALLHHLPEFVVLMYDCGVCILRQAHLGGNCCWVEMLAYLG
jgi:hypothetical protein